MHIVQSTKYAHHAMIVCPSLALDLVDGLGETTDIFAGDAGDRDAAVLGSVHRVLG